VSASTNLNWFSFFLSSSSSSFFVAASISWSFALFVDLAFLLFSFCFYIDKQLKEKEDS